MIEELQYSMFEQHTTIASILVLIVILISILFICLSTINNKIKELNNNIKYLNLKIDEKNEFINSIISRLCNAISKSEDKC